LRTGRDHRRAHTRQTKARQRFAQPMLSIHERDFEPTDRTVAGNWESQCRCQAILGVGSW
jgi:IS30 family transposase